MNRTIQLLVTALALLGLNLTNALAQQAPPSPSRWPAQLTTADGQVTFFQPQLVSFQGDVLAERSAVSVQLNGQQDPVFGAVWVQHHVYVDQPNNKIQIIDSAVTQSRFPSPDPVMDRAVSDAVAQLFGSAPVVLALDKVQATLAATDKEQAAAGQIASTPPKIVFYDHPVVKLQYDGTPRLVQIDNSNLLRAVNTPFFVVLDPASRTYFLKGGGYWFGAPDPMGPFARVDGVPQPVADLAASSGYQDPQQPIPPDQAAAVEIVTATDPTEVIWTSGPAQMSTIPGTGLLYVANTGSDVFLDIDNQQQFVLLSGRWYSAPNRQGPWTYVPSDQLPDDFRRIPPDSEKAGVLVSVPGTEAAQGAVADAYIPQTAAVDINKFDQPTVAYDGDPSFQPIEGTDLTYAVNTGASVIAADGRYYCCANGVWYESLSPVGPWGLSYHVPTEIYEIPPSCPIYPVRFVYIYGRNRDAVYYGYLPGYLGSYVYHGVVVYGTGFRYRPWVGRYYYPRPYTYGYAARYDFFTGHWGFDFGVALGGGYGLVAVFDDGHFHGDDRFRHDAWFGHAGFHPVYARDERHVEVARVAFDRDHAVHAGITVNLYSHRADVHQELIHTSAAPRGVTVRVTAGPRGPERAAPRFNGGRPDDQRPAAEPRRPEAPAAREPRPSNAPSVAGDSGRAVRGEAPADRPRTPAAAPKEPAAAPREPSAPPREPSAAPREPAPAPREPSAAPAHERPAAPPPSAPPAEEPRRQPPAAQPGGPSQPPAQPGQPKRPPQPKNPPGQGQGQGQGQDNRRGG